MNYADKKILVLGMGKTGVSMVKWLSRIGAQLTVADTRTNPPDLELINRIVPSEALFCGPLKAELFQGIDVIAISPGVAVAEPLVQAALQQGIPVIGDIELFAIALDQYAPPGTKILAITGSNGKTTVTTMVGEMARNAGWDVEVAGNIGPAALDALMQRMDAGKWPHLWVLELSSFQLETTSSLHPDAATVLNLSEDHMDRYSSIEEYAAAKARIFPHQFSNHCVQVLNRDDARVCAMADKNSKQVTFGLSTPSFEEEFGLLPDGSDLWLSQGSTSLMKTSELAVMGLHNAANALAALALCRAVDLPFEPLLHVLRNFRGLPHRMQKVAEFSGITFYDDSKSTNVGSAVAALSGFRKNVILIAGGDGKGQDFSPLEQPVRQHVRSVVLLGRDADKVEQAIQPSHVLVHRVQTMDEAVKVSFLLAEHGDAVLLSPACASLDMFNNYIHRAEVFTAAVRQIERKLVLTAQTCH
ncbi:UDP-N-acetylmuramoyl-L-alanine--D-glutamate ligase [uncultured Nitrosomonas sp.]|uniref:UDP-N-acetylmuramoyl-L-alanine--D-glutamate ligase n=1 Tax=uncultured Nitrosomonas sp. TaxID=156424 RepID=UPI00262B7C08|nr:UDP-N-acetylmuramoyl-L-alanine--D-glutamate ligase [uncultured Nitrosomonas sp.]